MLFENKVISIITKIFALPPIISGCFLLIYKMPEGLVWGVFFLALGLTVFGFKLKLYINEEYIERTIRLYGIKVSTKIMSLKEFDSICIGYKYYVNINAEAPGSRPGFEVIFNYKHPEKQFYTAYGIKGFEITGFIPSRLTRINKKSFDELARSFLVKLSKLTRLPIVYTEDVGKKYGVDIK